MKTIYHYKVRHFDGSGIIGAEKVFDVSELNVIGENEINIVVDDHSFTTVSKEKSDYRTSLETPQISINANDHIWGNGVRYDLFSFSSKKPLTIRKEIEKEIQKQLGFFTKSLNLGFIK